LVAVATESWEARRAHLRSFASSDSSSSAALAHSMQHSTPGYELAY